MRNGLAPWMCCLATASVGCHAPERHESAPVAPASVMPEVEAATSASTRAPSPAMPTHSLGEVAELPHYRVKLVSERNCDPAKSTGKEGAMRTFGVELEVTNLKSDRLATNPFYATLVDGERFTYTTSLRGCAPLLPARFLKARETVRGWVPFELPRNVVTAHLDYHPVLAGEAIQVARFRVEP